MESFWRHLWMLTSLVLLGFGTEDGHCLKNVSLMVYPPTVQRGGHASLLCQYDLEGAPLYSVKWYRGSFEFYRFSPGEKPATKIFPYSGIHVDLSVSNESVVVLRKVGFNLSGNFSCEVTVEAPSFSTATVYQPMLVVALPETPPEIQTEHDRYEPGDTLRANCTSPPSKPAASLSFFLNNIPVGVPEVRQYKTMPDSLQMSFLSLSTTLFPMHYQNGQLVLKCTAHVSTLYRRTSEVVLSSRAREPVPERVTSQNSSPRLATSAHILLMILGYHIAR
ncbi:uncharacterized protein [Periplaneta americana]|uniref:uncharacterized protein n=1 Tax=Periplaneta americana TaxID=6978 RepID=UPI0037E78DD6